MISGDNITLRLARLQAAERWSTGGCGLALVFPTGGVGEYIVGAVKRRIAPGEALVFDTGSGGAVSPMNGGEMTFWHFSISMEHMYPLFSSDELCLLESMAEGFKEAKLYRATSEPARECHRLLKEVPPQFDLGHRSQLLRIVAAILSEELKTTSGRRLGFGGVEEHMAQVLEGLSSADLLNLSVDDLAKKCHCSRRHLSRLFHHRFGISITGLRMELRLTKAASLLRNPQAKVIRVAEECGFHHLGLFNTCFKRRFGTTPGKWRGGMAPLGSRLTETVQVSQGEGVIGDGVYSLGVIGRFLHQDSTLMVPKPTPPARMASRNHGKMKAGGGLSKQEIHAATAAIL